MSFSNLVEDCSSRVSTVVHADARVSSGSSTVASVASPSLTRGVGGTRCASDLLASDVLASRLDGGCMFRATTGKVRHAREK